MVTAMDAAGLGGRSNHDEHEAVCLDGTSRPFIARLNRDGVKAA